MAAIKRLMPDRLDLGHHFSGCIGEAMYNYRDHLNNGKKDDGRYVMGYRLPIWQRPFVWTQGQSVKLLESLWLGIDIGTYTFNRSYDEDAYDNLLIDGQQRMKSIEDYINDAFPVFGYRWSEITDVDKRMFNGRHFHSFITQRNDDEYLRGYYNMMNFSGTAHKDTERA